MQKLLERFVSEELAKFNLVKLGYAITTDNRTSFKLCLPRADNTIIEI